MNSIPNSNKLGKRPGLNLADHGQSMFEHVFHNGEQELKNWKPNEGDSDGMIDVIDFFSGCGGMSLGFAAISRTTKYFNILGGVDISETALKTFSKNFNVPTLQKDIREIYDNKEYEDVKKYFGIEGKKRKPLVVIGCAPCQGFTSHRKKNWHEDDERNTLVGAFTEIALKLDPDYIIMENVPEILGKKYWAHYEEARSLLDASGYHLKQTIYNSATYGVPQERFRAIIIAAKKEISLPPELRERDNFVTVRQAISDLPEVKPGERLSNDPFHRSARHKKSTLDTISKVPKDGGSRPRGVGPQCLDKVNGFFDVYGRLYWDKPSITITQYSRNPASGRFTHPEQNRGLTIREAARLQSFPDGFIFEGTLDQCFKQIGEAVPPLLSLAMATQILIEHLFPEKSKTLNGVNVIESPVSSSFSSVIASLKTKKA